MKITPVLFACTALVLSGCTAAGLATGAGATVGVAAAQEGGLNRAMSDARIQIEINNLWFQYNVEAFRKLDMTVNQGRVLLTGVVQDPEMRVEAVRLAWQPEGVKQVINEIQVAESGGIMGFARDKWITTRLRTSLTLNKDVQSINYTIDTVQGVVYLMGTAQNQAELNRVIETARTVPDVKRVVSYVKMLGSPISNAPVQANQTYYDDVPAAAPAMDNASDYSSSSYNDGYSDGGYNESTSSGAPLGITRDQIESEPLQ